MQSMDDKFELTVLNATGYDVFASRAYATVQICDQSYTTKTTGRGFWPTWNETFTFATEGGDGHTVTITLYRKSLTGSEVFIGRITESLLEFQPPGKVLTKVIPSERSGGSLSVALRVGEITSRCRIFSLIIAINKYISPSIPDLNGCINDAHLFKAFLTQRLCVPESQIVLLANESATRDLILSTITTSLIHNAAIRSGDAIVIFFAGHGSRVKAPVGWDSIDGMIETICPHDERTMDPNGDHIHRIPDRTINYLIHELAAAKGNNITLIIDSCHSGGIMQSSLSPVSLTPRSIDTARPVPHTLDSMFWSQDATLTIPVNIPSGFQYKSMSSHVVLAACRQGEYAHELLSHDGSSSGFFTNSLLKHLHDAALDRVTYSDLADRTPALVNQSPQCEGDNKDCIIFSNKALVPDGKEFPLTYVSPRRFEINAGSTHGVVRGTEFIIQVQNRGYWHHRDLGILIADSIDVDSSILVSRQGDDDFIVPPGAVARISSRNNGFVTLKVFLQSDCQRSLEIVLFSARDPTQLVSTPETGNVKFIQSHCRSKADVAVGLDPEANLVIERLDSIISTYADHSTSFQLKMIPNVLLPIFNAVAHFNFLLGWHHGGDPLDRQVTLELYRLSGPFGFRVPDTDSGNLLIDSHAKLFHDEDAKYGIAIVNYSNHDLFPYLFYFDPAAYTIEMWYSPLSTSPPLGSQQGSNPTRITAGYGAGGGYAFEFVVPPGKQSDTGFLKLFVSTTYVDMQWMTQLSPIDPMFSQRSARREMFSGIWDAWIAAVTVDEESG